MSTVRGGVFALLIMAVACADRAATPDAPQASVPAPLVFAAELNVQLDSMTLLADGVRFEDVRAGSGAVVADSSSVRVAYRAWLPDGTLFEQRPSEDGFGMSEFVIGSESAPVPGVSSGMIGMRVGGVRRIVVPPELGYGLVGRPANVPAGSTLLFEISLHGAR